MNAKVLLVDDEQSLLNGLERRLGLEFDIETACSGDEALQKMEDAGPFWVVVTDMQMPRMNGIQFIQHARILAPETVYIMLTGNQDLQTASQAVNNGEVFRFLNKPCEIDEIKRALKSGLRQYELVSSEKELLHKTFVGTINVLSDLLEFSQPDLFSRSPTVEETFENLRTGLDLKDRWEYRLASRLGLIGFAILSDDERRVFEETPVTSPESQQVIRQMSVMGGRLLEKIPRLDIVARIICKQCDISGELPDAEEKNTVEIAATLLRVAVLWSSLRSSGLSTAESLEELQAILPSVSKDIARALIKMSPLEGRATCILEVAALREGMVAAKDIVTIDDERLVREGRHLSNAMIEKLRLYSQTQKSLKPIEVVESVGIADSQAVGV